MNKMVLALVLGAVLAHETGCTALSYQPQELMSQNRAHLTQLQTGMSKAEALKVMGTEGKEGCRSVGPFLTCLHTELINNPYRTSGFVVKDKPYEVLYYWTDIKQRDDAITDDELTPLIFEDGKLIGWGRDLLDVTLNRYEIRVR